eukprot:GEMP01005473.1.p1 GENE.GEMP01005473.1~~GEMP01005473.1.p1  ORF type:complete len:1100 (+),score=183.72 GEMP01005473.1:81-3380(+)
MHAMLWLISLNLFAVVAAALKNDCVPSPLLVRDERCVYDFQCKSRHCSAYTKRCTIYPAMHEIARRMTATHGFEGYKEEYADVCYPPKLDLKCTCRDDGMPDPSQWDPKKCACTDDFLRQYKNDDWVTCSNASIEIGATSSNPRRALQGAFSKRSYEQSVDLKIRTHFTKYRDVKLNKDLVTIIKGNLPPSENLFVRIQMLGNHTILEANWDTEDRVILLFTYTAEVAGTDFHEVYAYAQEALFAKAIAEAGAKFYDDNTLSFEVYEAGYNKPVETQPMDEIDYCAAFCVPSKIGNGVCDIRCYVEDCNWDNGDCGYGTGCASFCTPERRGNYWCDAECYNEACHFDDGDCLAGYGCMHNCNLADWAQNSVCDWRCFNAACNWDGGDCDVVNIVINFGADCTGPCEASLGGRCSYCGTGKCCKKEPYALRSDKDYNMCSPMEGGEDTHRCIRTTVPGCGDGCLFDMRANENCDISCYSQECEWDDLDCGIPGCADRCIASFLGDNVCDLVCFNAACNWDNGDCGTRGCRDGCLPQWLGNGVCDSACISVECLWDLGDCGVQKEFMQVVYFFVSSWQDVIVNFPELNTEMFTPMMHYTIVEALTRNSQKSAESLSVTIVDARLSPSAIGGRRARRLGFGFELRMQYKCTVMSTDFDLIFDLIQRPTFAAYLEMAISKAPGLEFFGFIIHDITYAVPLTEIVEAFQEVEGNLVYYSGETCGLVESKEENVRRTIGLCVKPGGKPQRFTCLKPGLMEVLYYEDDECTVRTPMVEVVAHDACTQSADSKRFYRYDWSGGCLPIPDKTFTQNLLFIIRPVEGWQDKEASLLAEADETTEPPVGNGEETPNPRRMQEENEQVEVLIGATWPTDFVGMRFADDVMESIIFNALPTRPSTTTKVLKVVEVAPPADFLPVGGQFRSFKVTFSVTLRTEYYNDVLEFCGLPEFRAQLWKYASRVPSQVYSVDFVASWPPGAGKQEETVKVVEKVAVEEETCLAEELLILTISIAAIGWICCALAIFLLHKRLEKSPGLRRYLTRTGSDSIESDSGSFGDAPGQLATHVCFESSIDEPQPFSPPNLGTRGLSRNNSMVSSMTSEADTPRS